MSILSAGPLMLFSFVFVISLVVVIHELGHYLAGRMCGIHAEVFSLGFGPTLYSRRDSKGTVWRVAALPLGGYVRFMGDAGAASEPDAEKLEEMRKTYGPDAERCYHFKPVGQRAFVTLAGPLANFILAIVLFTGIAVFAGWNRMPPVVGEVQAETPAAAAGFQTGDRILNIQGREIEDFGEIRMEVMWRAGVELDFLVERDGQEIVLRAGAERRRVADGLGGERSVGVLGLGWPRGETIERVEYNLFTGFLRGADQIRDTVSLTGRYVGGILTGQASPELLSGPLGIANMAGRVGQISVEAGDTAGESALNLLVNLLNLAAFVSIGLGLVNLLPIPILDGGHLVYYAYEAVARRPLSMKAQAMGFRVGLALVLGMMLLATWNDINYQLGQFF